MSVEMFTISTCGKANGCLSGEEVALPYGLVDRQAEIAMPDHGTAQ